MDLKELEKLLSKINVTIYTDEEKTKCKTFDVLFAEISHYWDILVDDYKEQIYTLLGVPTGY